MTSRIGKPDTDADRELRGCLDAKKLTSFIMIAGAGSGKTTSLVKALDYISKTRGNNLKRQGRKVACITYTEVAEREIWGDVGQSPLFHVSTIHSFLWTVIQPFQSDIRYWLEGRINKKVADLEAKLANPRTRQATRERATLDIQAYHAQRAEISNIRRFRYGTGSDYMAGVLGHADILAMVPELINKRPLLRTLIAQRFPYTFIDESQDTVADVVNALKAIDSDPSTSFCLGFFGDPMQKIYPSGIGDIPVATGWKTIKKGENFRCSQKVLDVVNNIRRPADGLEQKPGKKVNPHSAENYEGTARIFILPADEHRTQRVSSVREWLARNNNDKGWLDNTNQEELRVLVIVHRMAAQRLGFPDLYAALNDNNPPSSLKDGFLDGTTWAVRPFLIQLAVLKRFCREGVSSGGGCRPRGERRLP